VVISEPITLITDYLLGGLTGVLAWGLVRQSRSQKAIGFWAAAFAATAMGSLVGGTYHGFGPALAPSAASAFWTATTLAMGLASFFLLGGTIAAAFTGAMRRTLLSAAAIKLAAYSWWMTSHDAFVYVILEYGSTLLFVLVLVAANRVRGEPGHRAYLVSGILISIVAALVQQSGLHLHTHFNHNDLMHVIQMGAVWLLYEGGRRLRDALSEPG
jgi:hypothetical protein